MILNVNPLKIDYTLGDHMPLRQKTKELSSIISFVYDKTLMNKIKLNHPLFVPIILLPKIKEIKSQKKFIEINDLIHHENNVKESLIFRRLSNSLNTKGFSKYKRFTMKNETEIIHFLNHYLLALYNDIKNDGFNFSLGSETIGNSYLDKNGYIIKSNGSNHRFYMAKICGLNSFPLRLRYFHPSFKDDYKKGAFHLLTKLNSLLPENNLSFISKKIID